MADRSGSSLLPKIGDTSSTHHRLGRQMASSCSQHVEVPTSGMLPHYVCQDLIAVPGTEEACLLL